MIYKIKIKKIEIWYPEIVVEADSAKDAMEYCKNNIEWHEDTNLDEANDSDMIQFIPIGAKKITNQIQLPGIYQMQSHPWNGNRQIRDILRDDE